MTHRELAAAASNEKLGCKPSGVRGVRQRLQRTLEVNKLVAAVLLPHLGACTLSDRGALGGVGTTNVRQHVL